MTNHTHTYALMIVSPHTFNEVKAKLEQAGYDHAILPGEVPQFPVLDMHGIGLSQEPPHMRAEETPNPNRTALESLMARMLRHAFMEGWQAFDKAWADNKDAAGLPHNGGEAWPEYSPAQADWERWQAHLAHVTGLDADYAPVEGGTPPDDRQRLLGLLRWAKAHVPQGSEVHHALVDELDRAHGT